MISKRITDLELIEEYIQSNATLSKTTQKGYKNQLTKFLHDVGISFFEIEQKHVANYLSQYEYKKTKTSYKTIIKVFFDWLIKHSFVKVNPTQDIKIKNGLKRKHKFIDQEDFQKIILQCSKLREKAIVLFLWYTGVRAKEFRNIKTSDIDFENDLIHIRVSKTSKGQRTIDIHPNLKPVLAKYIEKSNLYKKENKIDVPYLFLTTKGSKFHERTLIFFIKKLQSGLTTNYGCHDFRRAFVTNVYFATKDIVLAQELAGHESIETTRGYILNDPRMRKDKSRRFKAINF